MALLITLLGPPGSGKGTLARAIVERYGMTHLSTGKVLRDFSHGSSDLAIQIRRLLAEGIFAPDSVVNSIFEDTIAADMSCKGLIFDGYPRNIAQLEVFESLLQSRFPNVPHLIIFIDVDEQELKKRILDGRAVAEKRSDDTLSAFTTRMEEYRKNTLPVVNYYGVSGVLKNVVGTGRQSYEVLEDVQVLVDRVYRPVHSM